MKLRIHAAPLKLIIYLISFISALVMGSIRLGKIELTTNVYSLLLFSSMIGISLTLYEQVNEITNSKISKTWKILGVTTLLFFLPIILINTSIAFEKNKAVSNNAGIQYLICFMLNILYFILNKEAILKNEQIYKAALLFATGVYSLITALLKVLNIENVRNNPNVLFEFLFIISGIAICRALLEYYKIED